MEFRLNFYKIVLGTITILIEHSDTDDLIGCCRLYNKLIKYGNVYKLSRKDFNFLSKVFYKYRYIILYNNNNTDITNFVEILFHLIKLKDRDTSDEDINITTKRFLSDIDLNASSPDKYVSPLKSTSDSVLHDKVSMFKDPLVFLDEDFMSKIASFPGYDPNTSAFQSFGSFNHSSFLKN